MALKSEKPAVIEHLFRKRYDPKTGLVTPPEVTLSDVQAAIHATGSSLSSGNPANFMKDIVRRRNRDAYIPEIVLDSGYTVEQYVGEKNCFRFVPLPAGQTTPFAEMTPDPDLLDEDNIHVLQSISLPLEFRRLGRPDEPWLAQAAARLNLIHTHLALVSPLPVVELDLLQTNMKLGRSEVDALFLATLEEEPGNLSHGLVSCEAKSRKEELEKEQILRAAERVAIEGKKLELGEVKVIPMGLKALGDGLIWVVEFETDFPPLKVASEKVYRFEPAIKGVG